MTTVRFFKFAQVTFAVLALLLVVQTTWRHVDYQRGKAVSSEATEAKEVTLPEWTAEVNARVNASRDMLERQQTVFNYLTALVLWAIAGILSVIVSMTTMEKIIHDRIDGLLSDQERVIHNSSKIAENVLYFAKYAMEVQREVWVLEERVDMTQQILSAHMGYVPSKSKYVDEVSMRFGAAGLHEDCLGVRTLTEPMRLPIRYIYPGQLGVRSRGEWMYMSEYLDPRYARGGNP